MNLTQYQQLQQAEMYGVRIRPADLSDRSPRTLVYGHNGDLTTFHVYLTEDQKFVRVVYDGDDIVLAFVEKDMLEPCDFIPGKRACPAACDFEISQVLLRHGKPLPFTTFNEDRPAAQWYGKRYADLVSPAILPRLKVSIQVTPADIGLRNFGLDYGPRFAEEVESVVNRQAEGYLRSVLLRGKSPDEAKLWLDNIPMGLAGCVQRATGDHEWALASDLAEALLARVHRVVSERLQ